MSMPKWSLTRWIITINCVIAFWSLVLGPENPENWIKAGLPLNLPEFMAGQWWRVFTSGWVHADLLQYLSLHLIFNMMSLAMLGPAIENALGRKHFCLIYFPAGLLAVLFFLLEVFARVQFLGQSDCLQNSLLGASGSVMGLAAAFAVLHPDRRIIVLPWPSEVKALHAILAFCLVSLAMIFLPFPGIIAHSAHLGGAAWGFLYMGLIGWYARPGSAIPPSVFDNPEHVASESRMLESLAQKDIEQELPFVLRKIRLRGPQKLNRMEIAFLHKARSMDLI